jgi:hypothetical protein
VLLEIAARGQDAARSAPVAVARGSTFRDIPQDRL